MSDFSAEEIRALKQFVAFMRGGSGTGGGSKAGGSMAGGEQPAASDATLRGPYGNPIFRKMPKRWAGDDYTGCNYSDCPSDLLLCAAEFMEWKADKDAEKSDPPKHTNGTPYYEFNRKDASLARGWARRNEGKAMPPPAPGGGQSAGAGDPYAPRDGGSAGGSDFDNFANDPGEDEIPFVSPSDISLGARRRNRWQRF